jgi:hypothetical protein
MVSAGQHHPTILNLRPFSICFAEYPMALEEMGTLPSWRESHVDTPVPAPPNERCS